MITFWLRRLRAIPLLRAVVSSVDEGRYGVRFEKLRRDAAAVEYVWLDLCLVARVLFVIPAQLKDAKEAVVCGLHDLHAAERLSERLILEALGGADLDASDAQERQGERYTVTLFYKNVMVRVVQMKLPLNVDPLALPEVLARVLAASLRHLDEMGLHLLHAALGQMHSLYRETPALYETAQSLLEAPVIAFHGARGDKRFMVRAVSAVRKDLENRPT